MMWDGERSFQPATGLNSFDSISISGIADFAKAKCFKSGNSRLKDTQGRSKKAKKAVISLEKARKLPAM